MVKGHAFVLVRISFTANDGYQNFLVFPPMLSFLILDSNKKVTNWLSTVTWSENTKPFPTNLQGQIQD